MARYPAPLTDNEWNYLQGQLGKPLTEDYKRKIDEMAKNGRRIKVHS